MQHEAQAQEWADGLVQWRKPTDEGLPLHGNIEENAPEYYSDTVDVEKLEDRCIGRKSGGKMNRYVFEAEIYLTVFHLLYIQLENQFIQNI